jgi:hypothetical protein
MHYIHRFLCLSQARTWISNIICHGLFMFNELKWEARCERWEVINRFVYIVGIVDPHCLYFLFLTQTDICLMPGNTTVSILSFLLVEGFMYQCQYFTHKVQLFIFIISFTCYSYFTYNVYVHTFITIN